MSYKTAYEIFSNEYKGAVPSGDWTRGSGNFVNKRNIPAYCSEIAIADRASLQGFAKKAVDRIVKKRPRVKKAIYISNIRAFNRVHKKRLDKELISEKC